MSGDIVHQLRHSAESRRRDKRNGRLLDAAADEIERLQGLIDAYAAANGDIVFINPGRARYESHKALLAAATPKENTP